MQREFFYGFLLLFILFYCPMQFPRIKIGIGRPRYKETTEDYVLSSFYMDEREIIERVIHLAVRACELFVLEGVESAMNHINCQNLESKEVRY